MSDIENQIVNFLNRKMSSYIYVLAAILLRHFYNILQYDIYFKIANPIIDTVCFCVM